MTSSFDGFVENNATELLYRHVLGEYSTYGSGAEGNFDHWILPSPNLLAEVPSNLMPLNSKFGFTADRPKPFLPPAKINPASLKKGDPFQSIVKEKEKWEYELHYLIRWARKGKKWADKEKYPLNTSKLKKDDSSSHIYTVNTYANVARHVARDPYPFFSGKYNYLGTGGCLSQLSIEGEKCIIFPAGMDMDSLSVVAVDHLKEELSINQNCEEVSIPLVKGQRIYQVVAKDFGSKGTVCVRQERACSVVKVKKDSNNSLSTRVLLEIQETSGVFTSIDLEPTEGSELCTLDSDRNLKLWDISSSSCVANARIPKGSSEDCYSSLGSVIYGKESHELFIMNANTVFLKDRRMPLDKNIMEFSPVKVVDDCEHLSLLIHSITSPLMYVATSHQLLSLDIRKGWSQRWTHLLAAPAMYGCVFDDSWESAEVVFLSSWIPEDSVSVVNKWIDGKPVSVTFPFNGPSVADSLFFARAHGKCLESAISKRIEMATVGMTLFQSGSGDHFTCVRLSSIGDTFCQNFVRDSSDFSSKLTNTANIEAWEEWARAQTSFCSENYPELLCSTSSNNFIFNAVRAPLEKNKQTHSSILKWQETFPRKSDVPLNLPNEINISEVLFELGTYKDIMGQVLLQAWDTDGLTSQLGAEDRVQSWLDSVSSSPCSQQCGCSGDVCSCSASTSRRIPHLMSSTCASHDNEFKVPLTPAPKSKKKLKRESLGF